MITAKDIHLPLVFPLAKEDNPMVNSESDARTVNNAVRHQYRILTDDEKATMIKIKDIGLEFITLCEKTGNSRELSLAKTKIEEAVMWAVKHVTA